MRLQLKHAATLLVGLVLVGPMSADAQEGDWIVTRTAWQNERWGVYVEGSVVQTFFDDFLYLDSLTAVIVQTGLRFTP